MISDSIGHTPDEAQQVSSTLPKTPCAQSRLLAQALGQVVNMLGALGIDAAGRGDAAMREDEPARQNEDAGAPDGRVHRSLEKGVKDLRPAQGDGRRGARDGQLHVRSDDSAAEPDGGRGAEPAAPGHVRDDAMAGDLGGVAGGGRTTRDADGRPLARLERDPNVASRAARERARYHAPGERARQGCAEGSAAARLEIHKFTMFCSTPGCGALVDLRSAIAEATMADRTSFVAGDGCGAGTCSRSRDWRAGRFREQQRKMASQLLSGGRVLISRPADKLDKQRWLYDEQHTQTTAAAVLAANPTDAPTDSPIGTDAAVQPTPPALAALRALAAAQPTAAAAHAALDAPTRASVVALAAMATVAPAAIDAVIAATSRHAPTRAALAALLALTEATPADLASAIAAAGSTVLDDAAEAAITALAATEPTALAAALAATPASTPSRPALAALVAVVDAGQVATGQVATPTTHSAGESKSSASAATHSAGERTAGAGTASDGPPASPSYSSGYSPDPSPARPVVQLHAASGAGGGDGGDGCSQEQPSLKIRLRLTGGMGPGRGANSGKRPAPGQGARERRREKRAKENGAHLLYGARSPPRPPTQPPPPPPQPPKPPPPLPTGLERAQHRTWHAPGYVHSNTRVEPTAQLAEATLRASAAVQEAATAVATCRRTAGATSPFTPAAATFSSTPPAETAGAAATPRAPRQPRQQAGGRHA